MHANRIAIVVGFTIAVSTSAVAEKVYRWVDQDGKVHYSQTAPGAGATSEKAITTTTPPSAANAPDPEAEPEPERDERGQCLTIKCMADQMEADRLQRERGYAEQRAKNERALQKKSETAASKTPAGPLTEHDKQLQHNCKRGLFYGTNTRIDCDDVNALRKEWAKHADREMSQRDDRRRRGY